MENREAFRDLLLAELNNIVTPDDKYTKQIERIEAYFKSLMVPYNLDGSDPGNILTKRRKDFESICVALKTNGIVNPKNLTIFEFFQTIEYFEKRKKPTPRQ